MRSGRDVLLSLPCSPDSGWEDGGFLAEDGPLGNLVGICRQCHPAGDGVQACSLAIDGLLIPEARSCNRPKATQTRSQFIRSMQVLQEEFKAKMLRIHLS